MVWGAVVRVNRAGMTCPDWPRCQGAWLPALNNSTVFEWSHRLGAIIVTVIIALTFIMAWRCRFELPSALRAAWVGVGLIVAQIVAGWLTIKFQNNPPSVALHLVVGFLTFITLLIIAVIAHSAPSSAERGAREREFARLASSARSSRLPLSSPAGYMSAANDVHLVSRLSALQRLHRRNVTTAPADPHGASLCGVRHDRSGLDRLRGCDDDAARAQRHHDDFLACARSCHSPRCARHALTVVTRLDPVLRVWHEANGALLTGTLAVLTYFAYRGRQVAA